MPEFLRRPIHPEPGNASMAAAARLAKLYSLGQSNGVAWTTDYSATTFIQGEILQIPWRTKEESKTNKPSVPMPQKKTDDLGADAGKDLLTTTEGDDISLTSELGKSMQNGTVLTENTPLIVTMTLYQFPPNVPTLVSGAKNSFSADVGEVLRMFDLVREKHGAETALRDLFAKPCAAFLVPLDSIIAHIKASVMPPAEMEAKLEALPGVIG